jgi:hemoglobin-like flavoprotein
MTNTGRFHRAGNKGFNAQERQMILDSWKQLSDRHHQLITLFYARFFELLPEVKKLFDHVSTERMSRKIARTITAVLSVRNHACIDVPLR